MIKTLHITDPNNTPVKWWADVEGLQGIDRFDFTPGINILWGPNGIGKSTIILALARLTHCEQGGRSVVTSTSIRQLERGWGAREDFRKKELTSGMHIDFDGQPVVYRNPHNNVGLIGGMAGFDDDFYNEGLKSLGLRELSSGQQALASFHMKHPEKIEYRLNNEYSREIAEDLQIPGTLESTIDKGPKTILWDEPDANLDWPTKSDFWDMLLRLPQQHIVATHSPFALRMARVNLIELKPGYREKCQKVLEDWGLWNKQ